ncbi:MAG: metallophosphatase family protein [Acidobacteriales bacterium]|nr:metallophosphatase family protein [Terriglobales bacterium]
MRYLILSDIHANLEALNAVAVDASGIYDCIACCGDLVGYGADPNAVCDWARANIQLVIRGNHDRVCAGNSGAESFNERAQAAAAWTHAALSSVNLAWLHGLPQGPARIEGAQIAHGSPIDEDEYLLSEWEARQAAQQLDEGVYFFGHSHLQGGFLRDPKGVRSLARPTLAQRERLIALSPDHLYLINPGAVGQPRDGDARAAYALYDSEERAVSLRRAKYDVGKAQKKIRKAGLPDSLAARLSAGR